MRRIGVTTLTLAILFMPGVARASMGGPDIVAPLGWDVAERKVFFMIIHRDETARASAVVYFDLGSRHPERFAQVGWSRNGGGPRDTTYGPSLRALKRRLRPITVVDQEPTIPIYREVLRVDSLRLPHLGSMARFPVRFMDPAFMESHLEVTTLVEPTVCVPRHYRVPGRREIFAVVAFRATPYEMGYEVQVPVLLSSNRNMRRIVEWKSLP